MGGKPDIIRAILLIFAVGLVITGFTTLQASEDHRPAAVTKSSVAAESAYVVRAPVAR